MKQLSYLGLSIVILLSSCAAFHSGYMSNSVGLNQANFSYVKQGAEGKAKTTYIFGIGGYAKQTLVDAAKQDLLKNTPLKDNQALADITVNFKNTIILGAIYRRTTCVVTADIVQFK